MVRPLRLAFAGALYHVMARGNRREALYLDDSDFVQFLATLGEVCARFNCLVHAYCLMTNHYHLLIETPDGNLAQAMRQLNGVDTQFFNRRHGKVGHLFQGRYKAILVQKDAYLLELIPCCFPVSDLRMPIYSFTLQGKCIVISILTLIIGKVIG